MAGIGHPQYRKSIRPIRLLQEACLVHQLLADLGMLERGESTRVHTHICVDETEKSVGRMPRDCRVALEYRSRLDGGDRFFSSLNSTVCAS